MPQQSSPDRPDSNTSTKRGSGRALDVLTPVFLAMLTYGIPILAALGGNGIQPEILTATRLTTNAILTSLVVCMLVVSLQLLAVRRPLTELSTGGFSGLSHDFFSGLRLYVILMLGAYLAQLLLKPIGGASPPEALDAIATACRNSPTVLAALLGPVVWLQAALTEELTRAFMLKRLGAAWPGPGAGSVILLLHSAAFGLAHYYQGMQGVLGTFVIGMILGMAYMRQGRLLPLVLAHGLYDTTVILAMVYLGHSV